MDGCLIADHFEKNEREDHETCAAALGDLREVSRSYRIASKLPSSQIAAHESPRTTELNDRASDQISLDEIERA